MFLAVPLGLAAALNTSVAGQPPEPTTTDGKVVAIVEDFEWNEPDEPCLGWSMMAPEEAQPEQLGLTAHQEVEPAGEGVAEPRKWMFGQFDYDTGLEDARHWVGARLGMPVPGKVTAVQLLVCGDGLGNRLAVSIGDSTGEWLNYQGKPITWKGWQPVTILLNTPSAHGGGNADGVPDPPLAFNSVNIEPAGEPGPSTVFLDDIAVVTKIGPGEALYFRPVLRIEGARVLVQLSGTNLAATAQKADLVCQVLGADGQLILEELLPVSLEPGAQETFKVGVPAGQDARRVVLTVTYADGAASTLERAL